MGKYLVIGDKSAYTMDTKDCQTAWECAEKELKYGVSGNSKVITVTRKERANA